MLIKADKFLFLEKFMVVDRDEEGPETQVILWRPFLATSRAWIDELEGMVTFIIGGEKVTLYVPKWNNQANTMTKPPRAQHMEAKPSEFSFDELYEAQF